MGVPTNKDTVEDESTPDESTPDATTPANGASVTASVGGLTPGSGGALTPNRPVLAPQTSDAPETSGAEAKKLADARAAEVAAQKEAIRGKAVAATDSELAQTKDEADVLKRRQEADIKAGKLRPEPFQPIPYKPTKPTSMMDQWGSTAMLFAMLGSMFTRNHAVTALNAAAAAMNGFKQKDEAAAKQAMAELKVANQNLLDAANYQQKVYDNEMKDVKDREQYEKEALTTRGKERTARLKAVATAFDDKVLLAQLETGQAKNVYDEYTRSQNQAAALEEHTRKAEEAKDKQEAKNALSERLKDPKFLLLSSDEALAEVADLGADAVDMFNKPSFQTTVSAARVKATERTDEYKMADKATQLAMRADAGDKMAAKELAKNREREAKGQLSEQEQIDRTIVDERIARGLAPMPASGKAGTDTNKAYNATLARVLKINRDYDPKQAENAEKILAGWLNGANKDGSEIKAYNTATHHLDYMDQLVDALKTKNQQTLNTAIRRISAALGRPELENAGVDTMSAILADEITKATLGNTASAGERTSREAKFASTLPIDVLKTNIATSRAAIGGRLAASQKSFETGTGKAREVFWTLLEDGTKRVHAKVLGIPEGKVPKKEGAAETTTGAPAAGAPGAAAIDWAPTKEMQMPGGRIIGAINGKWIYKDTREEVK